MAEKERRRFVRIKDYMRLKFEVVPPEKMQYEEMVIERLQASVIEAGLKLRSGKGIMPEGFSNQNMQAIAEMLKVINEKLDYLVQHTLAKDTLADFDEPVLVDFSAAGMAFPCDEKFEDDQILKVALVLNETPPRRIDLLARVVRIYKRIEDGGGFENQVAVDFYNLDEGVRETLVQYVFAIQRQALRRAKMSDQI